MHAVQGWLPTVFESRGLTPDRAGQTTSGFLASFAVDVLTVPVIANRYAARRADLITCGSLIFLGVVGMIVGGIRLLMVAGVIVTEVGVGRLSPLVRAIPPDLDGVGARLTGTAMGFIFAVGEIGGFLGPVLIGTFHERTGSFLPGLGLLATAGLVVVLAGATLWRMRERC